MSVGTELDPGWTWDDQLSMAQAVKVGNFLYISGQIALDSAGKVVGEDDMGAQSQKVYENIESILKKAGGGFQNIVKVTAYLTDMGRYQQYNAVRARAFKDHKPASTTVEVCRLAFEGLLVEVEAVAYI